MLRNHRVSRWLLCKNVQYRKLLQLPTKKYFLNSPHSYVKYSLRLARIKKLEKGSCRELTFSLVRLTRYFPGRKSSSILNLYSNPFSRSFWNGEEWYNFSFFCEWKNFRSFKLVTSGESHFEKLVTSKIGHFKNFHLSSNSKTCSDGPKRWTPNRNLSLAFFTSLSSVTVKITEPDFLQSHSVVRRFSCKTGRLVLAINVSGSKLPKLSKKKWKISENLRYIR